MVSGEIKMTIFTLEDGVRFLKARFLVHKILGNGALYTNKDKGKSSISIKKLVQEVEKKAGTSFVNIGVTIEEYLYKLADEGVITIKDGVIANCRF